jgi:2'-5' RNA ligase
MESPAPDPTARARLFVALALPAESRASLAEWASEALGDDESLRLVDAAALHVTLVFLGWRPSSDIQAVAEAVRTGCRAHDAPELLPIGLAPLPKRQPRVLAVDVSDAGGRAAALQAAIAGSLVDAGLHTEERRVFRPHVTVARVRRGGRAPSGRLPDPPRLAAYAEEVVLYRSDLNSAGAKYTALSAVALQ